MSRNLPRSACAAIALSTLSALMIVACSDGGGRPATRRLDRVFDAFDQCDDAIASLGANGAG